MITKKAIITGLNSQDGSYLAEFLLNKGYKVIGTVRSKNPAWPYGFNPEAPNLEIIRVDLSYPEAIRCLMLSAGEVHECYNLAAQSHVGHSFSAPDETYKITGVGACLMMNEFFLNFPDGKFYQASSSEMFGNAYPNANGYDENDYFYPASPYGIAKTMAHYSARMYREIGKFASCGILFNHESPRRHESFVTQKICRYATMAAKCKKLGLKFPLLSLGNVQAVRDWGYAPEYVEIMWKILQKPTPNDFVVGTGKPYSVEYFAREAFSYVGLDWRAYTKININNFKRVNDISYLKANPATANKLLGRDLTTTPELIKIMMDSQAIMQNNDIENSYSTEKAQKPLV